MEGAPALATGFDNRDVASKSFSQRRNSLHRIYLAPTSGQRVKPENNYSSGGLLQTDGKLPKAPIIRDDDPAVLRR
jgi:hypothetical protein